MRKEDTRNVILAVVLTALLVLVWEIFVGLPMQQRQKEAAMRAQVAEQMQQQGAAAQQPGGGAAAIEQGAAAQARQFASREEAVAAGQRVRIETSRLSGSINLTGGIIDDLSLRGYRERLDHNSPNVSIFSPLGTPARLIDHKTIFENQSPYFASFGWKPSIQGTQIKLPDAATQWTIKSSGDASANAPVVLEWDNGEGLIFRRSIAIDAAQPDAVDQPRHTPKPVGGFLFTVTDTVENRTAAPVQLTPYAFIRRMGAPSVSGFAILHEGLIGSFDGSTVEKAYKSIEEDKSQSWRNVKGWLGFTDKYWASALVPDQNTTFTGHFVSAPVNGVLAFEADMEGEPRTIAAGASSQISTGLFTGAKEVATLKHYENKLGISNLSNLIDWGYLFFITKPLFRLIEILFHLFGNFGLAILCVTVLLKLAFFPLANRSFESSAQMKKVQPELVAIREQYADDKLKQQQAMMALYKEHKINPLAGCLPMLLQIPVFFALYKVLFVTIEMRQAPFIGWIQDLSAPDPTTLFNLFGLIPWTPPSLLMVGFWALLMGITMFIQMQLNPAPTDPTQAKMFRYMPIIFTFMLAQFPAGLVIYYAWNNTLSILQQAYIMKKNDVKIELWDNLKAMFVSRPESTQNQ